MIGEAEVLVVEGSVEECVVTELYRVLRLVEMDVEMVKALLLLRCAEARHLFDEMPQRITLPIQRKGDCIKTNQATKQIIGLTRLTK